MGIALPAEPLGEFAGELDAAAERGAARPQGDGHGGIDDGGDHGGKTRADLADADDDGAYRMHLVEEPAGRLGVHFGIEAVESVAGGLGDLDLFRQGEGVDGPEHGPADAHPRAHGRSGCVTQGADGRVVAILARAQGVDDPGFELAEGYEEVDAAQRADLREEIERFLPDSSVSVYDHSPLRTRAGPIACRRVILTQTR